MKKGEIVLRGCVLDVSQLSQKEINELERDEREQTRKDWNKNRLD